MSNLFVYFALAGVPNQRAAFVVCCVLPGDAGKTPTNEIRRNSGVLFFPEHQQKQKRGPPP